MKSINNSFAGILDVMKPAIGKVSNSVGRVAEGAADIAEDATKNVPSILYGIIPGIIFIIISIIIFIYYILKPDKNKKNKRKSILLKLQETWKYILIWLLVSIIIGIFLGFIIWKIVWYLKNPAILGLSMAYNTFSN
tara:strand:- start:423 stop:833 length:411 start_codon:yes stop_codon:yes gene_type:complete